MRIIGGQWRGRTIDALQGNEVTRPTTDRVREACASALDAALPEGIAGARVLDAFAGSGAFGLELLSRGAAHATFFEIDRRAFAQLKRNIAKLGPAVSAYRAVCGDVCLSARRGRVPGAPFSVVTLDPPYALGNGPVQALLADLAGQGMLAQDAVALYERSASTDVLEAHGFAHLRTHRYGKTAVDLLRYDPEAL